MKLRILTSLIAAAGLAAAAAPASAAPIVHDSIAEFTSIVANQGLATVTGPGDLGPVSASRSLLANMFDGDNNTMFTLGLGGTGSGGILDLVIFPSTNSISGGSVVELTNVGSGHREVAALYLGVDGGNYVFIGRLLNDTLGATVDTTGGSALATLSAIDGNGPTTFQLITTGGAFNTLRLIDESPVEGAGRDGFDVAELRITSGTREVPEPATLALLGAALLGFGGLRRARPAP